MRKIKSFLVIFCLFLTANAYPNDEIPKPDGWVNDYAGVIVPKTKERIIQLISELEVKSSVEIAIVTKQSIAPYDEKTYARLIFDKWRIGKSGKDNGVLLLLAIKERRWRIETGYGIEGILTDSVCGEIGRNYMVPYFKQVNYSEGLYSGVAALTKTIATGLNLNITGLNNIDLKKKNKDDSVFFYLFILLFFTIWNLPWPIYIGLTFTLVFSLGLAQKNLLAGFIPILGYLCSMLIRYNFWSRLSPEKRKNFFGPVSYGNLGGFGSGGHSGGFGGGGFGGGGGGGGGSGGGF